MMIIINNDDLIFQNKHYLKRMSNNFKIIHLYLKIITYFKMNEYFKIMSNFFNI